MTSTSTWCFSQLSVLRDISVWLLNGVAFQSTNKVLIITTTVASGVRWEWSKKVLLFTHLYAIAARYCLARKAPSFISLSLHIFLLSVCLPACLPPAHDPSWCASAILPWGYVDRPKAYTLLTQACHPFISLSLIIGLRSLTLFIN